MKKSLLLFAAALFSLIVSAGDGLTKEGASIIILPSSQWDGDIEWKAWTWVYNSHTDYGEMNSWNTNYNVICGEDFETGETGPRADSEGRMWYEPGYDMSWKEGEINYDEWDDETGEEMPIKWEEHTAPFSSDETYKGRPSYRWTTQNIMADIYVRRTFTTDQLLSGPVYLACGHDDAPAEYYINGELVFERTGWEGEHEVELKDAQGNVTEIVTAYADAWNNNEYILLTDEQKALIKLNGEENIIAFHVHQNWGGAFADCGLYTKLEGGLDMGYTKPWEGKVLFNNVGGYNRPSNGWSKLYEAQAGDEYSFIVPGSSIPGEIDINGDDIGSWEEQLYFKTPIKIEAEHSYVFEARILADSTFSAFNVYLTDNDSTHFELASIEEMELLATEETENNEGNLIQLTFEGSEFDELGSIVNNFMVAFDFGGGKDSTAVTIKDMSLRDITDGEEKAVELWVGTHYFNFIDMHKRVIKLVVWDDEIDNGPDKEKGNWRDAKDDELDYADENIVYEAVKAPEITGRVETLAWTLPDFDDSMWDSQMMPTSDTYPKLYWDIQPQSKWPGGDNTNYWIRRNFELDKINERVEYQLNVCHDDTYWTYVNGHLLQQNTGWTDGRNPVQVHIPARYLNVGKNVIATYIQQNWGGHFYDCGINLTEINYDQCLKQFNDALAYAQTDTMLTKAMKAEVQEIIADIQKFYQENKNDAAELRSYARDSIRSKVNAIFRYSDDVKTLWSTWDICRKMEDKGYWGTALDDAVAALDTCTAPKYWEKTLADLREARKATAMERHTEKYVGCVPEAVDILETGNPDGTPQYYIYNVGAKNFLGGGEQHGTHLAVEYASNPMMLIQAMQQDEEGLITDEPIDGAYYIETFRPNGVVGVNDFLGWNGFIDIPMTDKWELIPVEGKENVYNIAQYGSYHGTITDTLVVDGDSIFQETPIKKLLGLRNGDNAWGYSYYVVDTDNKTPELETNQWMFISRDEMTGFIANASLWFGHTTAVSLLTTYLRPLTKKRQLSLRRLMSQKMKNRWKCCQQVLTS